MYVAFTDTIASIQLILVIQCSYDSLLNCYQHVDGPDAGEYYCAIAPSGQLVGSFTFSSTAVPYSGGAGYSSSSNYIPYTTSAAYPSSSSYSGSGGSCGIGQDVCGSGCMSSTDTCCPSGQGSCSLGETCVTTDDGTEGCCPLGEECRGSVSGGGSYSSSSALYPTSSSAYFGGGYGSISASSAAGPTAFSGGSGGSSSSAAESSQPVTQGAGSGAATNGVGLGSLWQLLLGGVAVLFWL